MAKKVRRSSGAAQSADSNKKRTTSRPRKASGRNSGRNKRSEGSRFFVGIGASAGGLEALRALTSHLKNIPDATFIVVQHLSPQHRSMLVDLISRETRLAVKEAQDGDSPKPNTIYITPPNSNIFFEKGRLNLRKPVSKIGPKPSVDLFFESLAEELGEQAVGIILSGTGSDGARGIRAIKAAGGLTIAQAPDSAKYDGMPASAIESGSVDFVADPQGIAKELNQLGHLVQRERLALEAKTGDPYFELLNLLKAKAGVDFTSYKPNTIRRRLHRRMMATHVASLEEYLEFIEAHPKELFHLFQDILISVTCFFRDGSAFEELATQVAKRIRQRSYQDGVFRVWIPGCASGEEAYTLAILITEILTAEKSALKVQLFATDIAEAALVTARKGIYPEAAVERVPRKYREKYFSQTNDGFQVKKEIRDKVVFARQDLLKDPPFLKLDLISCRNVFIYFAPEAQDRVFRVFHYALAPQGLLFLGKSEALGKSESFFKQVSHRARLFSRKNAVTAIPNLVRAAEDPALQVKAKATVRGRNHEAEALASAIAQIAPNSLIVDEHFNLKKINGSVSDLLKIPTGEVTQSLFRYVNPELRSELTTLLHRCRKEMVRVVGRPREALVDGELRTIQFSAVPLKSEATADFLVEMIQNVPATKKKTTSVVRKSGNLNDRVRELEQELAATKEHQQTLVEELETSNEELQALNEELQSANEELQSSNEELETSNEELHATNEELTTLNEEINVKSAESAALNEHLEGIQNSIRHPLFVVDRELRLVRFNEACEDIFRGSDVAVGKSVRMIPTTFDMTAAFDAIEKCLKSQAPATTQIESGKLIFELRVHPLKNSRDELQGAVVVLSDISELIQALRAVTEKENMFQSILRNTPAVVSLKDATGRYEFVNDRFCEVFDLSQGEIVGRTDDEIFPQTTAQEMRERDFETLAKRQPISFDEEIALPKESEPRVFFSAKVPLLDSRKDARSVCTISLDVTEKRKAEVLIRAQQEQLIRVGKLSALGEMSAGIAHELNTPLNAILGNVDVLEMLAQNDVLKADEVLNAGRNIQRLVEGISNIITGLRNLARMESSEFVKKDLRTLIRETADVCGLHLRNHGVKLKLTLPSQPVEIECQPIQLSQVLINLLNNAVDAIEHKEDKWICVELEEKTSTVEIRVIDCGDGISQEIADKIMTPFFTTKAPGKGTGMGLSLSQSIVGMHRGQLLLDPAHSNTCFKVILPKERGHGADRGHDRTQSIGAS